jgi:glycosyltransferase involved in cell wall biosynthesis
VYQLLQAGENETGALFERMNPESMADALEKLITNEDLREKFSANGRQRILETFDINNTIDEHINYYSVNG